MIRHHKTDHKAYQEQEPADFRLCKWAIGKIAWTKLFKILGWNVF